MPVVQGTLFGGTVITGNIVDKLTYILEEHPEAREDYKAAIALYWSEFDGLCEILGDKVTEFQEWFEEHATSPQTIRNRTQEIQNKRPDLDASSETEKWRQRRSRSGRQIR